MRIPATMPAAHARPLASRPGFSLLEILLVIALIGLLMSVAAIAFAPALLRGQESTTKIQMRQTAQALTSYSAANAGSYPATLDALVPGYLEKKPRDGWKTDFFYKVGSATPGKPFDLISSGADKQPETADDIDWWKVEQES